MTTKTFQISSGYDDAGYWKTMGDYGWGPGLSDIDVGYLNAFDRDFGIRLRFTNISIPKNAVITSAYLKVYAATNRNVTVVRSTIRAVNVDNAPTHTGLTQIKQERGLAGNPGYCTSPVNWDSICPFTIGNWYQSPDISSIIQAIINRAGWASGNAVAIYWDDSDGRSDHNTACFREINAYEAGSNPAKLIITYETITPPPTPPTPPPPGTGQLNVYAVADSEEITASVMVVETGKMYSTAFAEYLDEGIYTLRATYEGQTLTQSVTITEDEATTKIFRFTKIHDVTITSDPTPIDFTLNGEKQSTPFNQPMVSGTYTVVFPSSWMVGVDEYVFTQWENGSVNPSRTVTLGSPEAELVATYRLKQIDEAGPINQLQHKDNLKQVFGGDKDLSEDNPLPVNVVEGGITLPDPLPTEDTGKNTNPEKWLHDNHWDNGAELILNAVAAVNLGAAVATGATRRVRSITVRNTAQANTVITLSQVAPAQNRVSFDVPAQTTRVWSEQDAIEFLAGVQVQIASSAAAVGAETYIHASGVEV